MESSVAAVSAWLRACSQEFDRRVEELNELDRILGDGDHGTNMQRGFAAAGALDFGAQATAADALRQVGMALVKVVGGASGPLFGTFLLRTGAAWPTPLTVAGIHGALDVGLHGVMTRGKAERGDKTIVDALAPVVDSLAASAAAGLPLDQALTAAALAGEAGRDATAPMLARRGRAVLKADRSIGVIDPGAVSMSIIVSTGAHHLG